MSRNTTPNIPSAQHRDRPVKLRDKDLWVYTFTDNGQTRVHLISPPLKPLTMSDRFPSEKEAWEWVRQNLGEGDSSYEG